MVNRSNTGEVVWQFRGVRKVECRVNWMTGHDHRCKMPVEVRQSMMVLSLSVSEWQQLAEMVVLAL